MVETKFLNFEQAARRMAQMIVTASRDPKVVNLAVKLIHGQQQGFYADEAAALCSYTQHRIRYTNDTFNEDIFRAPALTVELRSGDCNNKAVLFGSLARAVGFPVRLVFVFQQKQPDLVVDFPMHVYAEVDVYKGERAGRKWICCEATPLPNANGRLGVIPEFGVAGEGGGLRIRADVEELAGSRV